MGLDGGGGGDGERVDRPGGINSAHTHKRTHSDSNTKGGREASSTGILWRKCESLELASGPGIHIRYKVLIPRAILVAANETGKIFRLRQN